jgi:hypothetical protein
VENVSTGTSKSVYALRKRILTPCDEWKPVNTGVPEKWLKPNRQFPISAIDCYPLSAYPNNPEALSAMRAQAK